MTYSTISRDPFARQDTVRQSVTTTQSCSWCGQTRNGGKLFEYGTQPDSISGRINWHRGLFCSKGCHNSYHS